MELLGYIAAAFIGVSLGLIGAGGSILTVPVIVFLFGVPQIVSTSYSLFIVGITSMISAIIKYISGDIDLKTAFTFGFISTFVVMMIRKFLIPMIPADLYHIGGIQITYNWVSMVMFSILMLLAAVSMIKQNTDTGDAKPVEKQSTVNLMLCAVLVGIVTGILGAGGGFIIIPALVMYLNLDIKKAVGTSLAIIALNALTGFTMDVARQPVNWSFLLLITAIAVGGSLVGSAISKRIEAGRLKTAFGWFVMALGVIILIKNGAELFVKLLNVPAIAA